MASGADYNRWERSRAKHKENFQGAKQYVSDIVNYGASKGDNSGNSASRAGNPNDPSFVGPKPQGGAGNTSGDETTLPK